MLLQVHVPVTLIPPRTKRTNIASKDLVVPMKKKSPVRYRCVFLLDNHMQMRSTIAVGFNNPPHAPNRDTGHTELSKRFLERTMTASVRESDTPGTHSKRTIGRGIMEGTRSRKRTTKSFKLLRRNWNSMPASRPARRKRHLRGTARRQPAAFVLGRCPSHIIVLVLLALRGRKVQRWVYSAGSVGCSAGSATETSISGSEKREDGWELSMLTGKQS